MKNAGFLVLLPFIASIFLPNCTVETPSQQEDGFETVNIADSLGLDSNEARIYLLPTPLQVTSALISCSLSYSRELIEKINEKQTTSSEFYNALNLGINTIDIGYAALNGDYQTSLNYLKNTEQIMNELGIRSVIETNMIARFEHNMYNQDSIGKIILETYSAAHKYFQQNGQEGMGLLILTGCFIEGLYLAVAIAETQNNKKIINIIAQQKLFLANIIELLGFYIKQSDTADLLDKLKDLQKAFENIDVSYDEIKSDYLNRTKDVKISPEQLRKIREKVFALRKEIRI